MDDTGCDRVGNGRPVRQAGKREPDAADGTSRQADPGERHQLVLDLLGDGVPARVQRAGPDDDNDEEKSEVRLSGHLTEGSLRACRHEPSGLLSRQVWGTCHQAPWRRSVQTAAALIVVTS